jgi:hypothetical protein
MPTPNYNADESLNQIRTNTPLPEDPHPSSPGPEGKTEDSPPLVTKGVIDPSNENAFPTSSNSNSISPWPFPDGTVASEDPYLGQVLEVFPDINYDYVFALFTMEMERRRVASEVANITERIVVEILRQLPYPKQKSLKRKRSASSISEPAADADGLYD